MDAAQLLDAYVARHNEGVRSGDFSALLDLLAPKAEMRFVGTDVGPLVGKDAIAAAFKQNPPNDTLVLLSVMAGGNKASAIYAWSQAPTTKAGTLVLTGANAKIDKLTVAVSQRK